MRSAVATYELWDMASRNQLGAFPTEAEALLVVVEAIERNGIEYADALALGREDQRGRSKMLSSGRALAARAQMTARKHGARVFV
jgi:hypothetical protein